MQHVDYWGQAVEQSRFLKWLALLMTLAVVGLTGKDLYRTYQGTPIHYIPCGGPGVSMPGVLSDGYATHFASQWLTARYSFQPETIEAAVKEVTVGLHPSVRNAFGKGAQEEVRMVRGDKLGAHTTVVSATVQGRNGDEVIVAIEALRSVYMNKVHLRTDDMRGVIGVRPWVGEGHQRGAVVSRLDLKPSFGKVGE